MLVSSKRTAERWSVPDAEILKHETLDEAVEAYLDGYRFSGSQPDTPQELRACLRELGQISVTGYARGEVSARDAAKCALEEVGEWLDGEWGDPDGGPTLWSEETEAAARALGKSMMADFWVWSMEPITSERINALEWVERCAPHWVADSKGA